MIADDVEMICRTGQPQHALLSLALVEFEHGGWEAALDVGQNMARQETQTLS